MHWLIFAGGQALTGFAIFGELDFGVAIVEFCIGQFLCVMAFVHVITRRV